MSRAGNLNILLVEDDEVDVMNVQRAFRDEPRVNPLYVASDGVDGLEQLRAGAVPLRRLLVLLDINMPRMNGIEFLRVLRATDELRSLPVVVLTTSDDDQDKLDAYDLNAAGYLLKPVTRERFVATMQSLTDYWLNVEFP